jgi:hypothetical protein
VTFLSNEDGIIPSVPYNISKEDVKAPFAFDAGVVIAPVDSYSRTSLKQASEALETKKSRFRGMLFVIPKGFKPPTF